MKIIAAKNDTASVEGLNLVSLSNDIDPRERIDLTFPKFSDGRAFSQAFLLRRRLGFKGEIRATGDVLIDQLVQMQRSGFSTAVLREDQNIDFAQRQFDRYSMFYQGDAVQIAPQFIAGSASRISESATL
jgi:uncharacterized protein (DUF934 family)